MPAPIIMRPWPRWLGLDEAAEYAGLGRDRLKALACERKVVGFPDPEDRRGGNRKTGKPSEGRWIFDRESLDAYRLEQAGLGPVKKAVLASQGRLGL